jgi:hypothetical protein
MSLARLSIVVILCFTGVKYSFGKEKLNVTATQNFNKHSFAFTENAGQLYSNDATGLESILYYGHSNGVNIYLEKSKISYVCNYIKPGKMLDDRREPSKLVRAERMEMEFLNTNPAVRVNHSKPLSAVNNFYFPHLNNGLKKVRDYGEITYTDLYPGIDMILNCNEDGFEYSFVVHPGADPAQISIQWNGVHKKDQNETGLAFKNGIGYVEEEGLKAYQTTGSEKIINTPSVKYVVSGDRINFKVGPYDVSKPLIIDPVVSWGTYFGGTQLDGVNEIKRDGKNRLYCVGYTYSLKAIASKGAFQVSDSGGQDGFFTCFDTAGNRLWSTYYGGASYDELYNIDIDSLSKYIYILGQTQTAQGLATKFAYQTLLNGRQNLVLLKFDSTGNRVWSTYYGGNLDDYAGGILLDEWQHIYISGFSNSSLSIATPNGWRQTRAANWDGILIKMDTAGNRIWGTYYGGRGDDVLLKMVRDSSSGIFISGKTLSDTGIATKGAYSTKYNGAFLYDALLANFDSSGRRVWGTYFGGNYYDNINGIDKDNKGNLYIAGRTQSTTGIATKGAYRTKNGGLDEAFLACFGYTGKIKWSTYYGGTGYDLFNKIKVDTITNHLYLCGASTSTSKIATSGAYQTKNAGQYDLMLARFSPSGTPDWVTYYGGSDTEYCYTMSIDNSYGLYYGGTTKSTSKFTKGNIWQKKNGGNYDGFILKFTDSVCGLNARVIGSNKLCLNNIAQYTSAYDTSATYTWMANGGSTYKWNGKDTIEVKWDSAGKRSLQLTMKNGFCSNSNTLNVDINALPALNAGTDTTVCPGSTVLRGMRPDTGISYSWSSVPIGYSSSLSNLKIVAASKTVVYYLSATDSISGCSNKDSVVITTYPKPVAGIIGDTVTCAGAAYSYIAKGRNDKAYAWSSPAGAVMGAGNDSIGLVWSSAGKSSLQLKQTNKYGCMDSNEVPILIHPSPVATWRDSMLSKTSFMFYANDTHEKKYYWQFGDNTTDTNIIASHTYAYDSGHRVSLKVTNVFGCSSIHDSTFGITTGFIASLSGDIHLNIYPNPFSERLTAYIEAPYSLYGSYILTDISGKELASSSIKALAGMNQYSIETASLSSGMYFIKLNFGDKRVTQMLVKL